jgi:hypothetical protein
MIIRIPYELSPLKVSKEAREAANERHPKTRKHAAACDEVTAKALKTGGETAPAESAVEIPELLPAFVDELIESAVIREEAMPAETPAEEMAASTAPAESEPADVVGAWEALLAVDLADGSASSAAPESAVPHEQIEAEKTIEPKHEARQQPVAQVARFLRHELATPAAALAKKAVASEQVLPAIAELDDVDSMTSQQAHAFLKALIEIAELEAPEKDSQPITEVAAHNQTTQVETSMAESPKAEPAAETFAGVLAKNASWSPASESQVPAVAAPVTASILVPPPADKKMPRPPALLRAWWWLKKNQRFTAARQLRVVETISLGEKRFAAIIQADGKRLLVGGAPSGVSVLAELNASNDGGLASSNRGSVAE